METPPTAIWKMLPFATAIGWPVKLPNQQRTPALSVSSTDAMLHAPPEPFVHVNAEPAGSVTALPALDAVDAELSAVPPAVYPVPVNSVPDADAVDAIDVSLTFIADPDRAVPNEPGMPPVPVGVVWFRIFETMAESIAAIYRPLSVIIGAFPDMTEDTCSLGDGRPRYARGWCSMHYMRWYTYGDPLASKRILGDDRARFEVKVDRSGGPDACHLWLGARTAGGYGYFWINGRMRNAHQVAWEFTHAPTARSGELDHECHNSAVRDGTCRAGKCRHRLCCNESHLTPKTRQEHVADTEPFARVRGTANGRAKLTEEKVREIKAALRAGATAASLARRYGVGQSTVRAIRDRRTWVDIS